MALGIGVVHYFGRSQKGGSGGGGFTGGNVRPARATASVTAIGPTVTVGANQFVTAGAAAAMAVAIDPTVTVANNDVVLTPAEAVASASAVDPAVAADAIVAPEAAPAVATAVDPSVVADGAIAPEAAVAAASAIDPTLVANAVVAPEAAAAAAVAVDPTAITDDISTPEAAVSVAAAIDPVVVANEIVLSEPATALGAAVDPTVLATLIMSPAAAIGAATALDPTVIGDQVITPAVAAAIATAFGPSLPGLTVPAIDYDGFQSQLFKEDGFDGVSDGADISYAEFWLPAIDGAEMVLAFGDGTVPWVVLRNSDDEYEFIGGTTGAVFHVVTDPVPASLGRVLVLATATGTTASLTVTDATGTEVGVNTPGSATNLDFTADTRFGSWDGSTGMQQGTVHQKWLDFTYMGAADDADVIEQFLDTTTHTLRDPGADGSNPLDGDHLPVACFSNTATSHTVNSGSGGDADIGSGMFSAGVSPGDYAADFSPAGNVLVTPGNAGATATAVDPFIAGDTFVSPLAAAAAATAIDPTVLDGSVEPDLLNVVAYENTSVSASPYNVGSYTAEAGSNRIVYWFESTEVASPGSGATAVAWGGEAMSLAEEVTQVGNWARKWYILEANFPSGATGDIVATIGTIADNAHIKSRAATGVNLLQQGPEVTAETAQTTDPVNTSITPVTPDAFIIDCGSCGASGAIAVTQGPDQVSVVADAAAGGRGVGIGISKRHATTTDPVTMGWDHSGTPNRWAHVVSAWARADAGGGGGTPATITQTDAVNNGSNIQTYTYTGRSFGAEAADRFIAVTFHIIHGLAGPPDVSGVTIGGETASIEVQRKSGSGTHSGIAIVALPTGTTGDVVVTTSGGNKLGCYITIHRITGIGSATAHDFDSANGTDLSVTLTVPANGIALGAAIAKTGGAGNCAWTGLTETADAGTDNDSTSTAANGEFETGDDVAMAAVFTTAASTDTAVYASWAPA